jgi:ADP-ribosylglycohydrolase
MAGSHDPNDRSTASLARVVSAVAWSVHDPAAAVALAGECSRTTHQSPVVLDACRYFAALLLGAIAGASRETVLHGIYEPVPGLWAARPLRAELADRLQDSSLQPPARGVGDVIDALLVTRAAVAQAKDLPAAIETAVAASREPALAGALAGALTGAFLGSDAVASVTSGALTRPEIVEELAVRLAAAGGNGR